MAIVARHVTIFGKVQGVFYRGWTVETAQALGLVGWVRNRLGGHVEALVQGKQADIEQFLQLARSGPLAARVEDVSDKPAQIAHFRGFEQRPTC
jgi:acylphosphatase